MKFRHWQHRHQDVQLAQRLSTDAREADSHFLNRTSYEYIRLIMGGP